MNSLHIWLCRNDNDLSILLSISILRQTINKSQQYRWIWRCLWCIAISMLWIISIFITYNCLSADFGNALFHWKRLPISTKNYFFKHIFVFYFFFTFHKQFNRNFAVQHRCQYNLLRSTCFFWSPRNTPSTKIVFVLFLNVAILNLQIKLRIVSLRCISLRKIVLCALICEK